MLLMEESPGTIIVGMTKMHRESRLSGARRVSRRRERGGRLTSSSAVTTGSAPSPTLAFASLLLLFTPRPVDGFFRPSTRVKAPPPGPKSLSSLPQNRDQHAPPLVLPLQQQTGGSSEAASLAALRRRFPSLLMSAAEDAGETESVDEQLVKSDEDGAEEGVGMPSIDVPDMMDIEERTRLWMAVARMEGEATRLERQGETEEAIIVRARANKMRYEDPYTALQDELDEAIKNEELVKVARLRLQMRRLGVPPNAEMQARAEGRDPNSAAAEAARQMPGMTNRESEMSMGSRSGTRGDGTVMTDGYSSKSDTTTHGVRVEVRSQYYPEQSNPLKDQYIFVYKVKITNQSPQTVQLVSRTWEIKAIEAREAPQVVKGPGVVGQQPVLEPGQSFEYSSACPITCAPKEGYQVLGRMKGSYLIVMGAVGEAAFEAKIDSFYLILPQSVLDERAGGNKGGGNAGGGDVAGSW